MIDTLLTFETPEGIDLNFEVAGPLVRILAYMIDIVIQGVIIIILSIITQYLDKLGVGLWLLCAFLLQWFFPVYFEVFHNGETPGKKAMKIRVVNDDGTPINYSASVIRNLLRAVDFLPGSYAIGLVSMVISPGFKRLGDIAAGTVVIYSHRKTDRPRIPSDRSRNSPFPLKFEEQQTVLGFAERSTLLSGERRVELAEILSPITGQKGEQAIEEIHQIANGLRGNR